jgi:enterochelin esterase family protein
MAGMSSYGNGFRKFLEKVEKLPESQRQELVNRFLASVHHLPLVEHDTLVHFMYNGKAQSVSMAGDATGWKPGEPFTNLKGTDFWYYTTIYESDARLDYKLVINNSEWILDPGNPDTCQGGFGPNSELRMPHCQVVPPEPIYYENIPHGNIVDTSFFSVHLGNTREIKIYLPAGYGEKTAVYPVILFHDGLDYFRVCKANNILDYLIYNKMMAPVIGIFVPAVNREEEYAGAKKDLFTQFIVNELMPVIDKRYRTSTEPGKRAMIGASNGGNISLYIGVRHPEVFGKIGAQSSNVIREITDALMAEQKPNLSFYLDIGKYDIDILVPMVHNLKNLLEKQKYTYQYYQWNEGHSWGNWKEHLRYPLKYFFPVKK